MIWFGSSAGVAISNLFPEARSVGAWLKGGWHVAAGLRRRLLRAAGHCSAGIRTRRIGDAHGVSHDRQPDRAAVARRRRATRWRAWRSCRSGRRRRIRRGRRTRPACSAPLRRARSPTSAASSSVSAPPVAPRGHAVPAAGLAGAVRDSLRADDQLRRAGAAHRRRQGGARRRRREWRQPDRDHRPLPSRDWRERLPHRLRRRASDQARAARSGAGNAHDSCRRDPSGRVGKNQGLVPSGLGGRAFGRVGFGPVLRGEARALRASSALPSRGGATTAPMRRISRRLFLSTSSAAAALPLIRTVRLDAQVEPRVPPRRRQRRSARRPRDAVDARERRRQPTRRGQLGDRARSEVRAHRRARRSSRPAPARDFTVKVDVDRPRAGHDLLLPLRGGGGAVADRPHAHAAARAASSRSASAWCRARTTRSATSTPTPRSRSAPDLDAVLHLGDYIYEYANGGFGDGTALGRMPSPTPRSSRSPTTASATRSTRPIPTRRTSTASTRSSSSGTITSSPTTPGPAGRENHNPEKGEGDWYARRSAAVQAFFEWMPIREDAAGAAVRASIARCGSATSPISSCSTRGWSGAICRRPRDDDAASIESPARRCSGAAQEGWLRGELAESKRERRALAAARASR